MGNTTSTLTSDSVPTASTNHQEFLRYRFVFVPVGLSEAVPPPGCRSYPVQERAAGEPAKGHEPYASAPARSVVGGRTQLCAVFLR
ncbi:hypothetical protein Anapl_14649 [Anas platyrhynchos]|uniref:Uncharacterized protein n=1 Tax=Anas platyrhynchos TaxID=8839 RepID=R0JTL5_ANAPL|nr:hypothetical protein Anapl_14649 [Anas platyrhynchos]